MIFYFILVFAVSWALWFAANAATGPAVRPVLIYTGVFTPGIIALALTRLRPCRELAGPMGLGPAGIVLGVIWAAWHLPLFHILGGDTVGQSFPFYLLQVIALSIVIAWVYMRTNGSLSVTMLLHAAVNNTKDIVPSAVPGASNPWALHASLTGWLTLTVLWVCAVAFLYDMRRDTSVSELAEAN